jgi:hypothetical protein
MFLGEAVAIAMVTLTLIYLAKQGFLHTIGKVLRSINEASRFP